MPEEEKKFPIGEIELWSNGRKLTPTTYGNTYNKVEKAIDGNPLTATKNVMPLPGRMFMLDLGGEEVVTDIVLYPSNDDNYIVPKNAYELFYFNNGKWTSLGKKNARGYSLTYYNVSVNALLLLRNNTKGHEERVFTIEEGKQVWW